MRLFPRYDGPSLLDQVCSVENLTLAWRRVRSNIQLARRGRSAGPDAVSLRDFEADWTRQMTQLADELRSGAYRPLPHLRITIPKASGGERAIAILAVRDRIAQRAVHQVLEPLFDPFFLDCSYGCRPGVGVPEAVARVARYADQGLTWVVDADLADYFDSIDQRILLALVRQRVDELPLRHLLAQWLAAGSLVSSGADLRPGRRSLIERGREALRHTLAWNDDEFRHPPPALTAGDPYLAVAWEQAPAEHWPTAGHGQFNPHQLEHRLWTALTLAKPVVAGARRVLPYARRLGGRNLVLAGAVAAGAVTAGEIVKRTWGTSRRGTVQGSALSPLFANIYLHPFDLALTSQGFRLVRFMDDFVIMCASQAEAQHTLAVVQRQLATLHLQLNDDKTRIVNYADGLEFLGHALVGRPAGLRRAQGLASFEEAEQALRSAAGKVRRRWKKS